MSSHLPPPEPPASDGQAELAALLLDGIAPITPPLDMQDRLLARLAQRTAQSVAAHAALLTVRAQHSRWLNLSKGIRYKPLWQGPQGNSVLIEFAPGSTLPVHRHNWLEEGLVLQGGLQMGDLKLGVFDYHLSPPHSRHDRILSADGAVAYLRGTSLGNTGQVLRELAGGLLPCPGKAAKTVFYQDRDWQSVHPGVYKKELYDDGVLCSRFYRLEPGSTSPGHLHSEHEECLILTGAAFFGDILLLAGDYQLAPQGSVHGEAYSDVGALMFVRGKLESP